MRGQSNNRIMQVDGSGVVSKGNEVVKVEVVSLCGSSMLNLRKNRIELATKKLFNTSSGNELQNRPLMKDQFSK